jgi:hypothetical protein
MMTNRNRHFIEVLLSDHGELLAALAERAEQVRRDRAVYERMQTTEASEITAFYLPRVLSKTHAANAFRSFSGAP